MRAIADNIGLRGPPLPVDEVALAIVVGELTPGLTPREVAVDSVGVILILLTLLLCLDNIIKKIYIKDLYNLPAIQLLSVYINILGYIAPLYFGLRIFKRPV